MSVWELYQVVDLGWFDRKIEALGEAVAALIATDAACFSRLGEADEEIYAHLLALMDVYRRVTKIADGFAFDDPGVAAIMEGICEVLKSRLREFDDANTGGNPVKAEKNKILHAALADASAAMDELRGNYAIFLGDDFADLYAIYQDNLQSCLSHLDDLHGRQTARFYTELIEREFEGLGNIVKLPGVIEPQPDEQTATVVGILDALQEAYQMTKPVLKNFRSLIHNPQEATPPRTLEEFATALGDALPPPPGITEFCDALDARAAALFEETATDYKRAAYALQRIIGAKILLAEEITAVFEKAFEGLSIAGDETERDILTGIRETIEIKIAGLRESIANFANQGANTIKNFSAEKKPETERAEILQGIREAWFKNPPQSEDGVDEFFDACLSGELFAPARARLQAQIDTHTAQLEKSSYRFKREILLYEICTFEEILTHSVSRLRDSENAEVCDAATLLDGTFRELEVILKKNNIAVIRPAPGEIFNPREHEVLVAEKQDGFEKGEIIKIITAGYKLTDRVILRANVIAAR